MKNKKILVIAAHPDDEVLGCGGTLLKHATNNDKILLLFATDGESSRRSGSKKILYRKKQASKVARIINAQTPVFLNFPDNQLDKINILKIAKIFANIVHRFKPDIIYTHHYNDLNIDHRLTFEATMIACRPLVESSVTEIYCFEILSSTGWRGISNLAFKPNVYVDIKDYIRKKIDLMKIYEKEIRPSPHPRSVESINARAISRGSEVSLSYAESFELIRYIK
jgi:LmbE family N-acetylglucosaminyl deacetylase